MVACSAVNKKGRIMKKETKSDVIKLPIAIVKRYTNLLKNNQDVIDEKVAKKILQTLHSLNTEVKRTDFINRLEMLYSDEKIRCNMKEIIKMDERSTNYTVSLDMFAKMLNILSARYKDNSINKYKIPVYQAMILIQKNTCGQEGDNMKFEFIDSIAKISHDQIEEYRQFGAMWIEKMELIIKEKVEKIKLRAKAFLTADCHIANLQNLIKAQKGDIMLDQITMLYTPEVEIYPDEEKFAKYLWKSCKNKPLGAVVLEEAINERCEEDRNTDNNIRKFLFHPIHQRSESQFIFSCYFDTQKNSYNINPKYIIKYGNKVIWKSFTEKHLEKLERICQDVIDDVISK